MTNKDKLTQFAQFLKQADGLLITAGAGMGIDSGLPDFRGQDGFWNAYPPLRHLGKSFVEMAMPDLFNTNPRLAWGFYGLRLNSYRNTTAHNGFTLLKNWGEKLPNGAFIFTSNVDGQFQKAGFSEEQIMECHGSIHYLQCSQNCHRAIWSTDGFTPVVDEENCLLVNDFPKCPLCGSIARPNILMFNDWQWQDERTARQEFELIQWLRTVDNLAIIEMGAGTAIPSVRRFGESALYRQDKAVSLLRINPSEPQVPDLPNCFGVDLGAKATLLVLNELVEEGNLYN